MDVHDKLDEITRLVEEARAMPMSASALVHRDELLGLLDDLRELMPVELRDADVLLSDRDAVVAEGRQQAEQLLRQAEVEHERMVENTEIVRDARERADRLQAQAQAESTRLLSEADDYVDRKLGDFEITLDKLMHQVRRGREHLAERAAADRTPPRPGPPDQPSPEAVSSDLVDVNLSDASPIEVRHGTSVTLPASDQAFDQEDRELGPGLAVR